MDRESRIFGDTTGGHVEVCSSAGVAEVPIDKVSNIKSRNATRCLDCRHDSEALLLLAHIYRASTFSSGSQVPSLLPLLYADSHCIAP